MFASLRVYDQCGTAKCILGAVKTVLLNRYSHFLSAANEKAPVAYQGGGQSPGGPSSKQIKKIVFRVTVKIRTSGYQTLECFIATLQT